jgi:hypothetical protein
MSENTYASRQPTLGNPPLEDSLSHAVARICSKENNLLYTFRCSDDYRDRVRAGSLVGRNETNLLGCTSERLLRFELGEHFSQTICERERILVQRDSA